MTVSSADTLCKLIQETDHSLWQSYHAAREGSHTPGRIVFPKTSKGEVRVSEQEAKLCLIRHVANSPFSYSVETPTQLTYCFTGVGRRNAMTDVTLYEDGAPRANIEFKSGNVSAKRKNTTHITKDIEKLVCENVDAFWFHTLKATNDLSLTHLWGALRQALKEFVASQSVKYAPKRFTFHCCVLQQGFSVTTTFELNERSVEENWLKTLESPTVVIRKGQLVELQTAEGWSVLRLESALEMCTARSC